MKRKPKDKSHTRALGMGQTSITVPDALLQKVGEIAKKSTRSRNKQIQYFLEKGVEEYRKSHYS
jgi:metal-responsive CopG/Arc/MetJ family transcriptional regulator